MSSAESRPRIVIIAGPNGAGKTTFAREYLREFGGALEFVNADLIAAGLNPMNPEAAALTAGRLMLEEIERKVRSRKSFAFETTLAGRNYAKRIPRWKARGYTVTLIFLSLTTVEQAIARVEQRVIQGGHNIPVDVIRRRFLAGHANLEQVYKALVDDWLVFDNSGSSPQLLETS